MTHAFFLNPRCHLSSFSPGKVVLCFHQHRDGANQGSESVSFSIEGRVCASKAPRGSRHPGSFSRTKAGGVQRGSEAEFGVQETAKGSLREDLIQMVMQMAPEVH